MKFFVGDLSIDRSDEYRQTEGLEIYDAERRALEAGADGIIYTHLEFALADIIVWQWRHGELPLPWYYQDNDGNSTESLPVLLEADSEFWFAIQELAQEKSKGTITEDEYSEAVIEASDRQMKRIKSVGVYYRE